MKRCKKVIVIWIPVIAVILLINYVMETKELEVNTGTNYSTFKSQIDKTVPVLMDKYNIPGAAIALIRKGKVDSVKGYGWADKENKERVTEDTLFQVASNSKTVTVWGVMNLVEQGKLDLDKPVDSYLKNWKLPVTKYDNKEVTIRRLLSHTSGLIPISYAGYSPTGKLPTLVQSLSGNVKGVKELQLFTRPGTEFKYSGGGYSVLQMIIENVTGDSFSQYMKEEVLKPLGMKNSSFELSADMKKKAAKAYGFLGQSIPSYVYTEKAAAGLYSTVSDFAKFVEANINLANSKDIDRSLLTKNSLSQMLTPVKKDYGFGYIIKKMPDGTRLIYHGGENRGWRSQYVFLPEKADGMVVLTNSENGGNLHKDLVSMLSKWETGYSPDFYLMNVSQRIVIKTLTGVLLLLLVQGIWRLLRELVKKEMVFTFKIRGLMWSLVWAFVILLWWAAFYTGLLYNGWTLATFMPYGFLSLTKTVFVGCIFLIIRNGYKPMVR